MIAYSEYSWQSVLLAGVFLIPVYALLLPLAKWVRSQDPRPRVGVWFLYIYPYVATLLYTIGYAAGANVDGYLRSAEQFWGWVMYYMMWCLPVMFIVNKITGMYMKKEIPRIQEIPRSHPAVQLSADDLDAYRKSHTPRRLTPADTSPGRSHTSSPESAKD